MPQKSSEKFGVVESVVRSVVGFLIAFFLAYLFSLEFLGLSDQV